MPTVYGASASPFVRKVRVLLKEKKVSYELEEVNPFTQPPPELRKISPLGKIPAYKDGALTLADSSIICAYLERKHPEPALYPTDPYAYARALWFEEYGDTALYPVIGGKIFFPKILAPLLYNQKPDETAIQKAFDEELPPLFDYLEGQINSGDGIVEKCFTIGDIGLLTQFVILYYAGYSVDKARWPKLVRYVANVLARPSFMEAMAEERKAYPFLQEIRL